LPVIKNFWGRWIGGLFRPFLLKKLGFFLLKALVFYFKVNKVWKRFNFPTKEGLGGNWFPILLF